MNRVRIIPWVVGGGVALAIAAGFILSWRSSRPPVPALVRSGNLPDKFYQTLDSLRESVRSHRNDPVELRQLAHLYQANRFYPEAKACYHVIATTPAGLTAHDHYYLAEIATSEGDLASMQKELRAVLTTEPRYLPARLLLAEALFKSGSPEDARQEYLAVLALEPYQPQASMGLARIELQGGDDDSAVARLDELMAVHPESTSGAALFAKILERRGETDRAIAMTQWSLQKAEPIPSDPWRSELMVDVYDIASLGLRSEEYFKAGQIDAAVPLLLRMEALDPKSFVPHLLRGRLEALTHHEGAAVQQFRLALAKGGDPETICPYLVESLRTLGNLTEAAKLMADYYARRPDSVPLATTYADVAVQQGDEKLARSLLTKVLQKQPYLLSQNMNLAKILWLAGERDAAVTCLQRVASAYTTDVPSRALLGEYYLGKSDPWSAIKPLEQASASVPKRTPAQASVTRMLGTAYLQAGNAEAEKGRLAEAAGYFEKVIQLAPTDLNGFAGLANVWVQSKQFRRAAEALEKMVLIQPNNPTIHLSLGDVVYQDGNADQAQRHWQQARRLLAADDRELREALDLRLSGHITAETFR